MNAESLECGRAAEATAGRVPPPTTRQYRAGKVDRFERTRTNEV
jgi:hypothetical protein